MWSEKPTMKGSTIRATVTAMSAYPCSSGGMIRTIPVGHAVPTASTAAPMPNANAIHLAALSSKLRTSGSTIRTAASG